MSRILVCFFMFFIFLCGCEHFFTPRSTDTSSRAPTYEIKGSLLAQVNDWKIGVVDFEDQLDALKTLYPQADVRDADTKKKILRELINFEILAQEAQGRGMDKDKDVVEAVRNFKRTFLAQKMLERLARDNVVTQVEVENFYNSNKLNLKEPEERRIREIVVSSEPEAKDILIRILQGESFSVLARTHSIAESKDQGGDLGYLSPDPDKKFQKFWEEAFTKEEGAASNYFKGPDGYYIVKVEDVRGGKIKPLAELRENIETYLKAEKMEKRRDDLVSRAKQKMKVIINADLLE